MKFAKPMTDINKLYTVLVLFSLFLSFGTRDSNNQAICVCETPCLIFHPKE